MASTSPAQDVQALRAAVIALIHTAPYDDMLWPEIQAALQLSMHDVKITFMQYGNFNNAPPPEAPPPESPLANESPLARER
jgi:hypothetical protein